MPTPLAPRPPVYTLNSSKSTARMPAPCQHNNAKSHQPKGSGCLSSHPARPQARKHTWLCTPAPWTTQTHVYSRWAFHPTHTAKAHSRAKNYSITVTFGAGGLPSGEDPGFPTVGISETKIHPGAVDLRAASRPGAPPPPGWRAESAPSWRRLPQTWGLSSGPSHSLSTALLTLQQGKAGDLGGETAF